MANLATYLFEKGMSKVLLGKLSSDPIETFWSILTIEQCKFFHICRATVRCQKVNRDFISYTCIDMDNNLNDNMVFDNAAVDLKLEPIS